MQVTLTGGPTTGTRGDATDAVLGQPFPRGDTAAAHTGNPFQHSHRYTVHEGVWVDHQASE